MRFALGALMFAAACSNEPAASDAPAEAAGSFEQAATGPSPAATETAQIGLSLKWVAEGFSAPEGAALAPDGGYFISNVSGGAADADGDGWISRVSVGGELLEERWTDGLDAPKGMIVHNGALYVADITRVRRFDVDTGDALAALDIEGARFLNDVTVWRGDVYVSDSQTARIHRLSTGDDGLKSTVWREGPELRGVNGLLGDGERMLVSTMTSGSLFEATANGGWREIASGMTDADGIGVVDGGFLVSAWPGEIFFVTDGGETTSLVETRADGITQNDLSVFGDAVVVPNWRANTVTAWAVER